MAGDRNRTRGGRGDQPRFGSECGSLIGIASHPGRCSAAKRSFGMDGVEACSGAGFAGDSAGDCSCFSSARAADGRALCAGWQSRDAQRCEIGCNLKHSAAEDDFVAGLHYAARARLLVRSFARARARPRQDDGGGLSGGSARHAETCRAAGRKRHVYAYGQRLSARNRDVVYLAIRDAGSHLAHSRDCFGPFDRVDRRYVVVAKGAGIAGCGSSPRARSRPSSRSPAPG